MSIHSDYIALKVATALGAMTMPPAPPTGTLEAMKIATWKAICAALDPYFGWMYIEVDPTVPPGVVAPAKEADGGPAVAWQMDPNTDLPLALWIKVGTADTAWLRIWSSGSGVGDHLVKARNADATAVGGLLEKTIDSATVTRVQVTDDSDNDIEKIQFNVILSTPGQQQEEGAKLYPSHLRDPLLRDSCRCLLPHGEGIGFDFDGHGAWIPVSGQLYTWRASSVGKLYGQGVTNPNIEMSVGDRIFAWTLVPFGDDAKCFGPYEVVDAGSDSSYAVIRRTFDARTSGGLCYGMTVQITDPLAEHSGKYFRIVTGDPIQVDESSLTFELLASYTPNDTYNLRTMYQLASAGIVNPGGSLVSGITVTASTPGYIYWPYQSWYTLAGTPNLPARVAGRWNAQGVFTAWMDDAEDPQGSVTFTFEMRKLDGNVVELEPFVTLPFPPCSADGEQHILTTQADDAGGEQERADRWVLSVLVETTSTYPIQAQWRPWGATRDTWVQPPAAVGLTFSDHQALTGRSQDVVAGEEPCHPFSALQGGRPHTGVASATIDGNGIVTMGNADMSELSITGGGTINGIVDAVWLRGDVHSLYLTGATHTNPVTIATGATVGSGKLPFYLPHLKGNDANARQSVIIKTSPALLRLVVEPGLGVYLMGDPVPRGSSWYQGSGAPSSSTGVAGDEYLNTANGDTYERTDNTSGGWGSAIGNIKGPTGATGAAGAVGGAISIGYTFSTTTTDSDPGNGVLRLSNATQNASTTIRADLLDSGATDWSAVLGTFADSTNTLKGHIRLFKTSDITKWLLFSVSAVASPTGYKNITVANVGYSTASPFADSDAITLSFTRSGDKGTTGSQGPAMLYFPIGIAKSISGGNPVGFCFGSDNANATGLTSYATNGMQNDKNIFPWVAPVSGTITGLTLTMEGAAISTGDTPSGTYLRIDFFTAGDTSMTSLGTTNVYLLHDNLVGTNNTTTGGGKKQTVTVTGLSYSITQGDPLGIAFVPQGGNAAKINAILNLFGSMHFTPS